MSAWNVCGYYKETGRDSVDIAKGLHPQTKRLRSVIIATVRLCTEAVQQASSSEGYNQALQGNATKHYRQLSVARSW
jgi:hypothetical protein